MCRAAVGCAFPPPTFSVSGCNCQVCAGAGCLFSNKHAAGDGGTLKFLTRDSGFHFPERLAAACVVYCRLQFRSFGSWQMVATEIHIWNKRTFSQLRRVVSPELVEEYWNLLIRHMTSHDLKLEPK